MLATLIKTENLIGERVFLRVPRLEDFELWAKTRDISRARLKESGINAPKDETSKFGFRAMLKDITVASRADRAAHFFIFRRDTEAMVGGIALFDIRRGQFETATVSFWLAQDQEGQGLMGEALRIILRYGFNNLKLRRIEAICLTDNERSQALLRRTGFHAEGLAREAARVNGHWKDHLTFAILRSDPILGA